MIHLRNLELPQELAELYAMRAQAKVALGDLVGKPWEFPGPVMDLKNGSSFRCCTYGDIHYTHHAHDLA